MIKYFVSFKVISTCAHHREERPPAFWSTTLHGMQCGINAPAPPPVTFIGWPRGHHMMIYALHALLIQNIYQSYWCFVNNDILKRGWRHRKWFEKSINFKTQGPIGLSSKCSRGWLVELVVFKTKVKYKLINPRSYKIIDHHSFLKTTNFDPKCSALSLKYHLWTFPCSFLYIYFLFSMCFSFLILSFS